MAEDKPATSTARADDAGVMFAFAHDLRAYLRTILTRIQLVQRGGGGALSSDEQAMLQEAALAVDNIGGLLTAMLAYQDAKAGERVMELGLVIRGSIMETKPALSAAGAHVDLTNDLHVRVHAGLQKVIKELLVNACKFRDQNRPLRIRVASRLLPGEAIEISVSDNGVGVAPMYLERIFTPFHSLHSRDEFPGFGLGLATCRRIIADCGGTITAEGAVEGGLMIRITLPADSLS